MYLAQNEFYDQQDMIGFLSKEPEPYKFLSMDFNEKQQYQSRDTLPHVSFKLTLSDNSITYKRDAFTIIQLIRSIGGFNGAIIIFPAYLMSIYSGRMFQSDIQKEIPVRRQSRKGGKAQSIAEQRLKSGQPIEALTQEDVTCLFKETKSATKTNASFLSSLCYLSCICKDDRAMRLRKKAAARFEDNLDIRNLTAMHTNLS